MVEPRKNRVAGVCGTLRSEKGKETSGLVFVNFRHLLPWSVEKLREVTNQDTVWVNCI